MRKCLLFVLVISPFFLDGIDQKRDRFLFLYYYGDFAQAHDLLPQVYSDPITRQIWEQRLHLQEEFESCNYFDPEASSARDMAYLRIGNLSEAKFTKDDWISCWGKAMKAFWQNDSLTAREWTRKALNTAPDRPELLFLAGTLAESNEETIRYYQRYLEVPSEDAFQQQTLRYALDFLTKTRDIKLNIASEAEGIEPLQTEWDQKRILLKARIDEKRPVTLLLDTGAGGLVLKEGDWRPQVSSDFIILGLGKRMAVPAKRVVLNSFRATGFSIKNPIAAINQSFPGNIDGIAGTVLFSNHAILLSSRGNHKTILFPPQKDALAYLKSNGYSFKKAEPFSFHLVNRLIIVQGQIKNSPPHQNFLIDTGADRTMLNSSAARSYTRINYPLSASMRRNRKTAVKGIAGVADDFLITENVEIRIGSLEKSYNRMMAINLAEMSERMELEIDAILGLDFLSDYSLLIEYDKNRITFLQ